MIIGIKIDFNYLQLKWTKLKHWYKILSFHHAHGFRHSNKDRDAIIKELWDKY